ncbi:MULTISPECIES: MrpH family fimbial adhesin [unclassified Serratia (in: enterobacteria)]|uniref:MrpH family fimbial adhesin n=1 Tax=unclassified Serratia (in: enterobacteria) TaxID=2647522 RepID=UPI002ED20E1C|nr:hypothetical protein [Serratia sp. C2(2)]MEE4449682.1 hypothetical protein [Serratia sp. C2(1)]
MQLIFFCFFKRIHYLFTFFLFSPLLHAEIITDAVYIYQFPTSIYKYKITSADVNDTTANPCYKVTTCGIAVQWTYMSGGGNWGKLYRAYQYPWISNSKTMGDLGSALYANGLIGSEYIWGVTNSPMKCIYLGYVLSGGAFTPLPGVRCRSPTVDPALCHIEEGNMNIDYGAVNADRANGLVAQTVIHASCTQDMRIRVVDGTGAGSTVNLRPDGSLKAKITINGVPMYTGYSFTATPAGTALNIQAELIASGEVLPGDFNGVAVLVIAPA